jgi:hypothetical protein
VARGNLGDGVPLGVFPVQSDHGDVHILHVIRANGESLTVTEYKRVFEAITGWELEDHDVPMDWFAPEDRV